MRDVEESIPHNPFIIEIDGVQWSLRIRDESHREIELSVNLVVASWPPNYLQLRIQGEGIDHTAGYVLDDR